MIYPEDVPRVSSGQVLWALKTLIDAYADATLCVLDFSTGLIEKAIFTQHEWTLNLGERIIPRVWFDR